MRVAPDDFMIRHALDVAAQSPCRSKRGVAIYDIAIGAFRGAGHNSPPLPITCPGRSVCAGTCGQRSVHAEVRALRAAAAYRAMGYPPGPYDLIHVELATGPGLVVDVVGSPYGTPIGQALYVVACDGPSCPGCAVQILDVGFISGVWLYERAGCPYCEAGEIPVAQQCKRGAGGWRRYTAEEFHRASLARCGMAL